MKLTQITTNFAGQLNVNPRLVRIVVGDTLATVEALNYLKPLVLQGYSFLPTDFFFVSYSGGFGIFTPTINASGITLNPYISTGNVTLPVVNGNFSKFTGTSGLLEDAGVSATTFQQTNTIKCQYGAYAGGSATFSLTVSGVNSSGIAIASFYNQINAASILTVHSATNAINIVASADPGTSTVAFVYFSSAQ